MNLQSREIHMLVKAIFKEKDSVTFPIIEERLNNFLTKLTQDHLNLMG
jgi:hypothetical protein